jgi:hypothetical protein
MSGWATTRTRCWCQSVWGEFSMPGIWTRSEPGAQRPFMAGLAVQQRFARDAYRRFVQMFGKTCWTSTRSSSRSGTTRRAQGRTRTPTSTPHDLRALTGSSGIIRDETGEDFPEEPRARSREAIEAVFGPERGAGRCLPTAEQDQRRPGNGGQRGGHGAGNMGDDSGTAVKTTRNATGEKGRTATTRPTRRVRTSWPDPQHAARHAVAGAGEASHDGLLAGMSTSRTTTATCATSSSPSSAASCGSSRPA